MTYILFFLGFLFLIKGADLLVDGSSSIAKKFNISNLVIGLTIVAFGTSAPELVVNVIAALDNKTSLGFGNIIGSNIANVLLILGVAASIYPLTVHRNTIWKEIPFSLLAAILVGIMANDILIDKAEARIISRSEGLTLIGFFFVFLYYTVGIARSNKAEVVEEVEQYSTGKSIIMVILGFIGLVLGGEWIVNGAVKIALYFGLSESLIGFTILSIGTSLPELAASAVAAYKKQSDIAIGNVIGSNIFNIFWILSISSTITPIPLKIASNFDIGVLISANIILFFSLFIGSRQTLDRWQGIFFLLFYASYITYIVFRG
ncbi:MAG: calcium/sodium antiporter [Blastocatellia bacterium]